MQIKPLLLYRFRCTNSPCSEDTVTFATIASSQEEAYSIIYEEMLKDNFEEDISIEFLDARPIEKGMII